MSGRTKTGSVPPRIEALSEAAPPLVECRMAHHRERIQTKSYAYTAVFKPDPSGGYVVTFPAIANLATQGESLEEARRMAAECLRGHLEVLQELGHALPKPDAKIPKTPKAVREPIEVRLKIA